MMPEGVLLDTSFLLRLLNKDNKLFENANGYYKYFLENNISMYISTISIAEFCVLGSIDELPLRNLKVLPFNIDDAVRTGEFAYISFNQRDKLKLIERNIIPNDSKLFAQADVHKFVNFYISSDSESKKVYTLLKDTTTINFEFIDMHSAYSEFFGQMDFNVKTNTENDSIDI